MLQGIKIIFWLILTLVLGFALTVVLLIKYPVSEPNLPKAKFESPDFKQELPELKIYVINTAEASAPEAFLWYGGSLFSFKKLNYPTILVEHPKATFLIDGGIGKNFSNDLSQSTWLNRFMFKYLEKTPKQPAMAIQEKLKKIDFGLLTHAHIEHLSGLSDREGFPIKLLDSEWDHLMKSKQPASQHMSAAQIARAKDRFEKLTLKDEPYENFSKSFDLFGDGSVVLVSLPGHTPGSMGVFLNQSTDRRFLLVGDAIFSVDPQGQPRARSLLAELLLDSDRQQARTTRAKLRQLIEHSNEIQIIPQHDAIALKRLKKKDPLQSGGL